MLHLAQISVATLGAPIDDPANAGFLDAITRVHAAIDRSPGCIWRLSLEEGRATAVQLFENPRMLLSMSLWSSAKALQHYVFHGEHMAYLRRRREWFEPGSDRFAMWWVPGDVVPDIQEGLRRIEFYEKYGRSPYAFGFATMSSPFVIRRTTLDHEPTRELVRRLDAELAEVYGANGHFALDPAAVTGRNGAMVLAGFDGRPVGIGAIRRIDDLTAEVMRMYVDPELRGEKIGAAILDTLEHEAAQLGFRRLRLETGVHQHAAIGLYEGNGYERTALWSDDTPELTLAYAKALPA